MRIAVPPEVRVITVSTEGCGARVHVSVMEEAVKLEFSKLKDPGLAGTNGEQATIPPF